MTTEVHRATFSFAWRVTASAASLLLTRYSATGFSPLTVKPVTSFPFTKVFPTTFRQSFCLFSATIDATDPLLKATPTATTAKSVSSSSSSEPLPYDWKKQWYALTFTDHVLSPTKTAEAVPASVFDHPLVLWRDANSTLYCADDVCPHRAAALSEGRVRDGNLECLYHGWQFHGASGGKCVSVPQLAAGASIPKTACLSLKTVTEVEGIVWVYMDSNPPSFPPTKNSEDTDKPEVKNQYIFGDFQYDLPYDHSYLLENVLDPAHIPISHDRTDKSAKRELAQALEMEVVSVDSAGFRGRYRKTMAGQESNNPNALNNNTNPWITTEFEAPGIVRNRHKTKSLNIEAAIHCTPLGLGRTRLLLRAYFTGLPKFAIFMMRLKPKWMNHLNSCKVLEEDLGLIVSQEDHFARKAEKSREIVDDFLLLKSSDVFVKAYRKWLDRVGHGMPWYQGLTSSSLSSKATATNHELTPGLNRAGHRAGNVAETRYHRHVIHCPATRNALRNIVQAKWSSLGGLVASLTLLAGLLLFRVEAGAKTQKCLLSAVPVFAVAAALLNKLQQKFYFSYSRRDKMRGEKGV